LGGKEMLEAAGLACRSSQLQLLGITLLTSQRSADNKEFGFPQKDSDLVVKVLKGKSAVSAKSIFFDTTPIVKGLEHAVAFVSQVIKEVVLPDIHKADEKKEK
jgi:orotidine-5'-phosphate decarboxylase